MGCRDAWDAWTGFLSSQGSQGFSIGLDVVEDETSHLILNILVKDLVQ